MDRDKELDDLVDELKTPFIERPDEMDIRAGVLCWLDGSRVCGADCVAFNPEEQEAGLASDGPNKCLVLMYMGQQGSAALSIITANALLRKRDQDKARQETLK